MRPVATTITEIDNLPGDEVKFSISSANSAWVMRSMADLYSNRELACVREYSTNAFDSNKEKAIRDGHEIQPIEVSLPSAMNPYFSVQDYGVGMSETELREVYTQFGESTKRGSDDFNGMLGFGSKSAIAYTNTFTVTSVKDNIKTVAVVTRREDAMGGYLVTLKVIISGVHTNEPSGVHIQIPVHNWREFEQKAMDFYRFWKPGTVKVNGREPAWAVGEKIADNLYMYPQAGTSYVVMGNVPYRIANPDALFPKGMNRISFVAYVPIGAVEFTPSREDLKYSEHTKKNLHAIINDFISTAVASAKKEIAAATTHADAYLAWAKWRSVIGAGQVDDLTFKGDKLVEDFAIQGHRVDNGAYRYSTWAIKSWKVSLIKETVIVKDFDIILTTPHKKKVKDWMALKGIQAQYVIFTNDKITSPWIDPSRVYTWDTVKKEAPKPTKKPRVANTAWGRKAGSFDLITKSGRKEEQDVPSAKPLYFVSVKEYNRKRDLHTVLSEFNIDSEVVLVPDNRRDKFLRFYPHAEEIMPLLKKKVELNGPSLISKDGMEFLRMQHNERATLGAMDASKISDPEVKRLIELVKKGEAHYLAEYKRQHRLSSVLGMSGFVQHQYNNYWNSKETPLTKAYPLAANFDTYNKVNNNNHVYVYMEAVYAARKKGMNV